LTYSNEDQEALRWFMDGSQPTDSNLDQFAKELGMAEALPDIPTRPQDYGAAGAVAKARAAASSAAFIAAREATKAAGEAGATPEAAAEAGRAAAAEVMATAATKAQEYAEANPMAPAPEEPPAPGGDIFAIPGAPADDAPGDDATPWAGFDGPQLPADWMQAAADARDHEAALAAPVDWLPSAVQPLARELQAKGLDPIDHSDTLNAAADIVARSTLGTLTEADLTTADGINKALAALGLAPLFN
jgi:hypothetical protein